MLIRIILVLALLAQGCVPMSVKIASLVAEISADTSKLDSGLRSAKTSVSGFSSDLGAMGSKLLASAGWFAIAERGLTVLVKTIKESVAAAAESQSVMTKLNGTLQSMGRSTTAAEISKTADALMQMSAFDDEAILSAYTSIAKFESIDSTGMDRIVKTAMDVSAVMGGDLAGNAEGIARILETGVVPRTWAFNDALKAQVKALIDAGDSGGALNVVLGELNKRYGGQAAAELDTYAGSVKALSNEWENFLENLGGGAMSPGQKTNKWFTDLVASFNLMFSVAGKADRTLEDVHWEEYGIAWERSLKNAAEATDAANAALQNYGMGYSAIIDLAGQYADTDDRIAEAEQNLAQLRSYGYSENGAKISEAKQAIQDLQDAQNKATAQWIINTIQQSMAVDGISDAEYAFLLDYQVQTGLISEENAKRAQDAWDLAAEITAANASIPDEDVNIWARMQNPGGSGTSSAGRTSATARAAGGPLTGFDEVGEQGTEGIINGIVIPHGKWERMKRAGLVPGRHFATGGALPKPENNPDEGRYVGVKPWALSAYDPFTGTTTANYGYYNPATGQNVSTPNSAAVPSSSQSSTAAVTAAVASAASSTASVAAAAETISDSGKQTTAATEKNTAQNNQGNAAIIAKLTSIENMLAQNFQAMPKQWAAAQARTV